jgi:hypothetical protein
MASDFQTAYSGRTAVSPPAPPSQSSPCYLHRSGTLTQANDTPDTVVDLAAVGSLVLHGISVKTVGRILTNSDCRMRDNKSVFGGEGRGEGGGDILIVPVLINLFC